MSNDEMLPVTWRIFYPNGDEKTIEAAMPEDPGYHRLREFIEHWLKANGFERVRVLLENGEYGDMLVDDEGALKGLSRNEAATAIYRRNVLTHEPGTDPESLPCIYGIAMLPSRRVWF